jgi:hypothetical protein
VTIEEHIAVCMQQTGLVVGHAGAPAYAALCDAVAVDPALRTAAQRMIQDGVPLEKRDHITRWRSDLLRRALGESPNV